jgi:hypothetical protein
VFLGREQRRLIAEVDLRGRGVQDGEVQEQEGKKAHIRWVKGEFF